MSYNMRALIGRLNPTARGVMEGATGLCVSRTHYSVEFHHYLVKLIEADNTDATRIFRHYGVDTSKLAREIAGCARQDEAREHGRPGASETIMEMLKEAWSIGSLDYGAREIRTGFTVLALAQHEDLSQRVKSISKEFAKIDPDLLKKNFADIVHSSPEEVEAASQRLRRRRQAGGGGGPKPGGKTPNLDQFTVNLTRERAKQGKIDPVLGRDFEIRQVVDILTRRRQNNPILTGEAGVGKTAVVEGFALRIVDGDVPRRAEERDAAHAGPGAAAGRRGRQGRVREPAEGLIEEVKTSPTPIILFIDEAHTMIGAGGAGRQGDAANLLKPALARGELRTIAATTWAEYKKYFEKDPALARRFQVVKVEEPTEDVVHGDDARHGPRAREASQRAHPRRRRRRGRAAVAPLHRRTASCRTRRSACSTRRARASRLGQNAIPAQSKIAKRRLDDLARAGARARRAKPRSAPITPSAWQTIAKETRGDASRRWSNCRRAGRRSATW